MATVLAACGLVCGCGGMSASPSFSPMMLLLPGLGQQDRPVPPGVVPAPVSHPGALPARAG